ncbi:hypothetical protein FGADI_4566 [Fusarium gaditjirri]|uniref:Uncharacterized protein n=1 Tax=Fusarium gaditjirri TaxID=282569 RepID=A0A8H4TCI8_9HYPO|nr:hypothetical protein FGADI_4566 [Fusarium gaditjirri]
MLSPTGLIPVARLLMGPRTESQDDFLGSRNAINAYCHWITSSRIILIPDHSYIYLDSPLPALEFLHHLSMFAQVTMSAQDMQSQQATIIPMETLVNIARQTGIGNRYKLGSSRHSSHNTSFVSKPSRFSPKHKSHKAKCHDNAYDQGGVPVQMSDHVDVCVMVKVDAVDLTECEGPDGVEEAMENMGSAWVGTYLRCPINGQVEVTE